MTGRRAGVQVAEAGGVRIFAEKIDGLADLAGQTKATLAHVADVLPVGAQPGGQLLVLQNDFVSHFN